MNTANAARSIIDAFTIFPFAIVLALALGEAFKTVITEGEFIHWNRLYSLASFLLLILPFYQGMNRYLLLTYGVGAKLPTPDPRFLIIDGASFMMESALFFVMSRTLKLEEWWRFYLVVLVLLIIDSAWGWTTLLHASPETVEVTKRWIKLNVGTALSIIILVPIGIRFFNKHLSASIMTAAMLLRTILDYFNSWDFYFRPVS